ncbi:MAG: KpsF/GutQ family sugar-phosphate isomerase [Syntrophobacteraceae bacterium]|jgi:arabinose-5-phosphate isomerase|nr:KpsF/GutQ family sugar-phosphate isomerase [Syntrophobacteraceae bacterium]
MKEDPAAHGADCLASRAVNGDSDLVEIAREVLRIEADGILHLLDRVDGTFATAARWVFESTGRVIVTGIGKSGIVGRKIVATLSSTGTASFFLHPVEGMHGDLGMVRDEDIVLALSNSGETDELNAIIPSLRRMGARIIAFTGRIPSTLSQHSDLAIYTGVPREACPLGLAPTSSTTALLAMGDALAVALIRMRGFQAGDFRRYHPGGHLGERLQVPLRDVMIQGGAIPVVGSDTPVADALQEMSRKGMGATLVLGDSGEVEGIYTDGDLRRSLNRFPDLHRRRIDEVMTRKPRSIDWDRSVADALELMERHLITVLPVLGPDGELAGILHLHDLLGKGRIRFTRGA